MPVNLWIEHLAGELTSGFLAVTFQPVPVPCLAVPSSESFPFIIKLLWQSETDIEIPQNSLVLF